MKKLILYPKIYLNSVTEINIDFLKKNNLKGLILDVDNTLIDYDRKLEQKVIDWCLGLKQKGIKICILSNTNHIEKVKIASDRLKLEYIYFAKKPSKSGFKKAKALLNLPAENIGVVGDQIFTDVVGANRCKMYPILVKPIDKRDIFLTRLKRPFERIVLKRYLNKEDKKCL